MRLLIHCKYARCLTNKNSSELSSGMCVVISIVFHWVIYLCTEFGFMSFSHKWPSYRWCTYSNWSHYIPSLHLLSSPAHAQFCTNYSPPSPPRLTTLPLEVTLSDSYYFCIAFLSRQQMLYLCLALSCVESCYFANYEERKWHCWHVQLFLWANPIFRLESITLSTYLRILNSSSVSSRKSSGSTGSLGMPPWVLSFPVENFSGC